MRAGSSHTFPGHGGPALVINERHRQPWRCGLLGWMGGEGCGVVALLLAAVIFGSGILNLISVMGASEPPKLLATIFPFAFVRLTRTPTILIGFALILSSLMITFTACAYSGFALFRPVLYRFRIVPEERERARKSVELYSRTPLDFFKLWPDKSYFFSPSHHCAIAYRVASNVAIALGDPVGPEDEIESTVRGFVELCRNSGWAVAFHQTLPDFMPLYRSSGLRKLKVGDDAMVDLSRFSLEGKSKRELRCKLRQFEAKGIRTVEYQPPIPDDVIARLKVVSDRWLRIPGRRERGFTQGQFDPEYLRSTPVLAVVNHVGTVLAFINLISVNSKEITGDLMRRRMDAPNGIMDYLFLKLFAYARERGYPRVSLGMAPMTGFREDEKATAEERAIHYLFQQLDFLFSFRGLHHYKAKFATSWEPRFLIYKNMLDLPRIALVLRRLLETREEYTKDQGERRAKEKARA